MGPKQGVILAIVINKCNISLLTSYPERADGRDVHPSAHRHRLALPLPRHPRLRGAPGGGGEWVSGTLRSIQLFKLSHRYFSLPRFFNRTVAASAGPTNRCYQAHGLTATGLARWSFLNSLSIHISFILVLSFYLTWPRMASLPRCSKAESDLRPPKL